LLTLPPIGFLFSSFPLVLLMRGMFASRCHLFVGGAAVNSARE